MNILHFTYILEADPQVTQIYGDLKPGQKQTKTK